MTPTPAESSNPVAPKKRSSLTYFFLRGLAIILPPVLTLLILLWVANGFNSYVIRPVNLAVRYTVATWNHQIRDRKDLLAPPAGFPHLPEWRHQYLFSPELYERVKNTDMKKDELVDLLTTEWSNEVYVPMGRGPEPAQYVPLEDYDEVFKHLRPQPAPTTAIGLYMELATERYFPATWKLSAVALSVMIALLCFLGRFVTVRVGAWVVHKFELVMARVPLVRNVYSTVKQVTDFVFTEREVEFRRVVAIEYPRSGAWTLGFVTGEGMLDCERQAGEPMVTVLVPTSPMPMGGFTIMVPRSSVIDLDMTVDQAVQFIVSCGVLTPPAQRTTAAKKVDAVGRPGVSGEPAAAARAANSSDGGTLS
jgi:uncharacterized membrane protein